MKENCMNPKVNAWIMCVLILAALMASSASLNAQDRSPSSTLNVLYTFLGEADGADPYAGATLDPAGNLYGTTLFGGNLTDCRGGCGVVFKINPDGHESLLYTFTGIGTDGAYPFAGVMRDNAGILYGNTIGGGSNGNGVVYKLTPEATICRNALCPWNETILHIFGPNRGSDGIQPYADLIEDGNGNLYGTTAYGSSNGGFGSGTVFKIDSQGNYSIIYSFGGPPNDGLYAVAPLLLAANGNFYSTTGQGGTHDAGTVFELTPTQSGWTESVLYNFTGGTDGAYPFDGLIEDAQGNLYGTTSGGGSGYGVVFKLSRNSSGWTETVLYSFAGPPDGAAPAATLLMDSSGNLYGTTTAGGITAGCPLGSGGCGTVFKLTPHGSAWTESILWAFTGGADGALPYAPVVSDSHGNLYGTAYNGGDLNSTNPMCAAIGCGVVFKLTP